MKMTGAFLSSVLLALGCSGPRYRQSAGPVDRTRYMGTWYVWAGRTTSLEKGAHNAVEKYTWNPAQERIDIDFSYHKDSADGKLKTLPQKAWIVDGSGNAHWKIRPIWPLLFDYQIVALDPEYRWTAVGVPSGAYLWIMGREPVVSDAALAEIVAIVAKGGYPVQDVVRVEQKW